MKKLILTLTLALALALPALCLAGEGTTLWYGAHFNDWADTINSNTYAYISATNPNGYDATVEATYYDSDGLEFQNSSGIKTFQHIIPANAKKAWRPNDDLGLATSVELKGSYVLVATSGSVSVSEVQYNFALTSQTDYNPGDPLSVVTMPVHTVPSTFLTGDFTHLDPNCSRDADAVGDIVSYFSVNNPSDKYTAIVKISFRDMNGALYQLKDHDSDSTTTKTLTLGTHAQHAYCIEDFINIADPTVISKGVVTIDAVEGSVIGNYSNYLCEQTKNVKVYRSYGRPLSKRLNVQ
jgi:hypothetical protein